MRYILDSWAVLSLLEDGPGAAFVERAIADERPTMSWINVGEVYYILTRRLGTAPAEQAVRDLRASVELEVPSEQRIIEAAAIKANSTLAYADAFAAATAIAYDGTLLTGDPELLMQGSSWRWADLRATE